MKDPKYKVDRVKVSEYPAVVAVWESSVRFTHHFLKEGDIEYFKPLILNEYLKAVDLRCVRDHKLRIIGFLGVAKNKIEMLFVHPGSMGKGIGKVLLKFAVKKLHATKVDVNEDNQEAVGFYRHLGFKTNSRSELDPLGNPYPILHMELPAKHS